MRILTKAKRIRFPRKVLFSLLLLVWSLVFVVFTQYIQDEISDKQTTTELTQVFTRVDRQKHAFQLDEKLLYSKTSPWPQNLKVQKTVLIICNLYGSKDRSKLLHFLVRLLDGFRLQYVLTRTDEKTFFNIKEEVIRRDVASGKYATLVFVDIKSYLELRPNLQLIVKLYCKKFNTGLLFFSSNFAGPLAEFKINVRKFQKESNQGAVYAQVNEKSKLLRLTRPGGPAVKPSAPKGQATRWTLMSYDPVEAPWLETIEHLSLPWRMRTHVSIDPVSERATVVLDKGEEDGIKKVFFSGGFPFFLHTLVFLDCLDHLSPVTLTHSLQRYLQIDVDDIFIGRTGIRIKVEDVAEIIATQAFLAQKIPGFKFNLGFSGKGFKIGNDKENDGDEALIAHAHRFSWFDHLYNHEQAHLFSYEFLVKNMRNNEKFAKDHGIILNNSYTVAPHHSGVYPVHEPLYDAWSTMGRVRVTSTEEYPHLKPAWHRRGFIHKGIKVLPRQTCGLFTTSNFFSELRGGKRALDQSIEGGELFETLLMNPVVVVMTHMTNYANDHLALYMVTKLVNFVNRWTNIEIKYAPPTELADLYFNLFPGDKTPIWESPCDDNRHLAIWSKNSCARLPSFLVIGPPFGGVGLLQKLLGLQTEVLAMRSSNETMNEAHFFSSNKYFNGLDWYMEHFPEPANAYQISYEVSRTYLTSKKAPLRAHALLSSAKIVIVLDDPVKRAYRHYQHATSKNSAKLPTFDELMKVTTDSPYAALRREILASGQYADHIGRWMKYYDPRQMLIVNLDDLLSRPKSIMGWLQDFVNVEHPLDYGSLLRYDSELRLYCLSTNKNASCFGQAESEPVSMDQSTHRYLQHYYSRHSQELLRMNQKIQFPLPKWIREFG